MRGIRPKAVALLLSIAQQSSAIQFGGVASQTTAGVVENGATPWELLQGSSSPQAPAKTGCYLRKLRGCPNHPKFNSTGWKLAESAEKLRNAKLNRTACEVDAKADMMRFCGSSYIEALFVPPADAPPTKPGCFVRKLEGCPKHPEHNGTQWNEAEKARQAKQNRTLCEVDVKASMVRWCGTDKIEVMFVPGESPLPPAPLPKEPGCYTRKWACPNHPTFTSARWKHAKHAERESAAGSNRTFCEVDVKAQLAKYCGSDQLEVLFVPPVEEWSHDAVMKHAKSESVGSEGGIDGLSTLATGREAGAGAENASHAALMEPGGHASGELPTEPGCYLRKTKGCPNHPEFNSTAWGHAVNAERHGRAMENRTACEVDARDNTLRWCGTEDVEVLFVPPRAAESAAGGNTTAVVVGEEHAEQLAGAQASNELPTEPGCYVRAPTGCPNHPRFGSAAWEHDEQAERFFAKKQRNMCEVFRRQHLIVWCGTDNIEMVFVPSGPAAPAEESGANDPGPGQNSTERADTGSGPTVPVEGSGANDPGPGQNSTERADTGSASIMSGSLVGNSAGPAPQEPSSPGCYFRTPSGCPNHPELSSSAWKREGYGENYTGARTNRSACEVVRKMNLAKWCGAPEVQMRFIPAGAAGAFVTAPAR